MARRARRILQADRAHRGGNDRLRIERAAEPRSRCAVQHAGVVHCGGIGARRVVGGHVARYVPGRAALLVVDQQQREDGVVALHERESPTALGGIEPEAAGIGRHARGNRGVAGGQGGKRGEDCDDVADALHDELLQVAGRFRSVQSYPGTPRGSWVVLPIFAPITRGGYAGGARASRSRTGQRCPRRARSRSPACRPAPPRSGSRRNIRCRR